MANSELTPSPEPNKVDQAFFDMVSALGLDGESIVAAEEERKSLFEAIDPQIALTSKLMLEADEEMAVLDAKGELNGDRRHGLIDKFGRLWPFTNAVFTHTGGVMTYDAELGKFRRHAVYGQELTSQGFVVFLCPMEIEDGDELVKFQRVGYAFTTKLDDGETRQVIVLPEDSQGLAPPYDSPLARAARFKRENPEVAANVEESLFTMERDDQSLMELRGFYIDADPNDADGARRLTDALSYLNIRAELDKSMMHFLSIGKGDLTGVGPTGEKYKFTLTASYAAPVMLEHLHLLPRDVANGSVGEGVQRHIPFIQLLAYENNISRRLVVPLESLLWIQSARYAEPTPPKFPIHKQ